MKKLFQSAVFLTLLALAGTLVWGALQLEATIYIPLGVTVFTALLGLSATLLTQREIRRREIDAAYRKEKVEAYLSFLKLCEKLLLQAKDKRHALPEDEILLTMLDVRTRAVLYGSPTVLRGLYKFPKMARLGLSPLDVLEDIQRAIRDDLGLSNEGLERDFFAKLPLSDPDDLARVRQRQ